MIKQALEKGADLTQIDKQLIIARPALDRNIDLLLNEKTANLFLEMAIHYLPENQEREVIKLALEKGADLTQIDKQKIIQNYSTLLQHADLLLNEKTADLFLESALLHAPIKEEREMIELAFDTEGLTITNLALIAEDYLLNFGNLDPLARFLSRHFDLFLGESTFSFYKKVFALSASDSWDAKASLVIAQASELIIDDANSAEKMMYLAINQIQKMAHSDLTAEGYRENFAIYKKALSLAIEKGADIHSLDSRPMGSKSIMQLVGASDQELVSLLKSFGANCGPDGWRAEELYKEENFLLHEMRKDEISKKIISNLSAPKAEVEKIPHILHHIWFTNPNSPREITTDSLNVVIQNKNLFSTGTEKWTHIVWTNDPSLIPISAQTLRENGIEIRSIAAHDDGSYLYQQVQTKIQEKEWGIASDLFRYLVVYKLGGAYADLNFGFYKNISDFTYKFDYFAKDFINYFFAAKPEHPILASILFDVEKNLKSQASYRNNFAENEPFSKTAFATLLPFGLGFLKAANLGGNIDVVLPPNDFSDDDSFEVPKFIKVDSGCHFSIWNMMLYGNELEICLPFEKYYIGKDGISGEHLTWLENSN